MAIKSKEIPDKELQALLAQQAYIFNSRYTKYSYPYDDAIYNGLYAALKKYENELTKDLTGHDKGACRSLAINLVTKNLFSGGSDGRILRWSLKNGTWQMEPIVGARTSFQVYSIAVSSDGSKLVSGGMAFGDATKNYVELYDLKNITAAPKKITGYVYDVDDLIFTPDGKGLYGRDNSGKSIKFSDLNTATEIIKTKEKINSIALSKNGNLLAGAGNDGTLYLWDVNNNFTERVLYKNSDDGKSVAITSVSFTADRKIIIGDSKGLVKVMPLENVTPNSIRTLSGHTSGIEQIVFNNSGSFMATASDDKTVRLWNYNNLREQPIVLGGHADWVRTAVFSSDDEQLLAGMHGNAEKSDETIHAWPTKIETMAGILCGLLTRNLTDDEWATYVDETLTKENTCATFGKK